MPKPSLVIFDFDGTLADTWDWFAGELAEAAVAMGGRAATRAEMERLRGVGSREVMKALGIGWARLPFVAHRIRRRADEASSSFKLFDGVPELLSCLRSQGVDLALLSSNSRSAVENTLGEDVSALFRTRRCGAAAFGKARAFKSILRETGHDAASAVVVGDETRDVDAARAAGIEVVAVEWGFADPELLRRTAPGRTARDPDALRAMLL